MRLLKVKVDGAELFKNCLFELDFIATDRVPRDDEGNISDVTPVCEKSFRLHGKCYRHGWR